MRCAAFVFLALAACGSEPDAPRELPKLLFLTHSAGYRHEVVTRPAPRSLSFSEARLIKACEGRYEIVATQDAATAVDAKTLREYAAVVFYTTGELPIDEGNRTALLDYVRGGGAFVGIHPATDTFYKWPEYGEMVGAYFDGHPWHQRVKIKVEDRDHPATKHLGWHFEIVDEIYQFKSYNRSRLRVLLSIDVASVDLKAKGVKRWDGDFAVAWCKSYGKGRVFYTSLGHRPEVWKDERYLAHVLGGIEWAISPTR